MKKIKEYRMSLMEKDVIPSKDEGKMNYIIRSSAVLEIEKYIAEQSFEKELGTEEYEELVLNSSQIIYDALMNQKGARNIDSLGVWVTFQDGLHVDNSIDLSILEDIKKYGSEDINPVFEFFKMTVQE